jgi:Predicted nucleoside-diphosphate-sugar epimerases
MKVLVAGGTGFVGKYVVEALEKSTHSYTLLTRKKVSKPHVVVDFFDEESLKKAFEQEKPDVLINLIGILVEEPSKGITFENIHYLIPKNLYTVAKEYGIKHIIHMSALGVSEEAPSMYHHTKLLAEKFLMSLGIDYTIIRPSLIIGPEQRLFKDLDFFGKYFHIMAHPGILSYYFAPVDVRDVAFVFVKAIDDPNLKNKIIELCGKKPVSFDKLLKDSFKLLGRHAFIIRLPKSLMYISGALAEKILEPPPFSKDQILMMYKNNVCQGQDPWPLIGKGQIPYEESLKWAIENYKSNLKHSLKS